MLLLAKAGVVAVAVVVVVVVDLVGIYVLYFYTTANIT